MSIPVWTAALAFLTGFGLAKSQESGASHHVNEAAIAWEGNDGVPGARWKTLVLPRDDVQFGTFELAPRSTYPGHLHPAPEIYFVLSGTAEWTVGDETFTAEPGTAILTPPNAVHRMVNEGDEPVTAVWAWWAPGGDRKVFEGGYRFVEPLR